MARTVRESQIVVRISGALRGELEAAAEQDSRPLGSLIRKVLVDYAVGRVDEREQIIQHTAERVSGTENIQQEAV